MTTSTHRPSMTRAEKEQALITLTARLAMISENAGCASSGVVGNGDAKYFYRRQDLLRKAILRVAMAEVTE